MIRQRDRRQAPLIDPWEHLGPKRRQMLEDSWAGLFRQEILSELPVEQMASCFYKNLGRPAKELHTVLRVLILQQMQDLTDVETVNQLAFNEQWHFALDIHSGHLFVPAVERLPSRSPLPSQTAQKAPLSGLL